MKENTKTLLLVAGVFLIGILGLGYVENDGNKLNESGRPSPSPYIEPEPVAPVKPDKPCPGPGPCPINPW